MENAIIEKLIEEMEGEDELEEIDENVEKIKNIEKQRDFHFSL